MADGESVMALVAGGFGEGDREGGNEEGHGTARRGWCVRDLGGEWQPAGVRSDKGARSTTTGMGGGDGRGGSESGRPTAELGIGGICGRARARVVGARGEYEEKSPLVPKFMNPKFRALPPIFFASGLGGLNRRLRDLK